MKVSEVTFNIIKDYCGISDNDSDDILAALMETAKAFIGSYTGLTAEQIDEHEDIAYAYMVLVNEMYTNRDYSNLTARKAINSNQCVKTILGLHALNYVGWADE